MFRQTPSRRPVTVLSTLWTSTDVCFSRKLLALSSWTVPSPQSQGFTSSDLRWTLYHTTGHFLALQLCNTTGGYMSGIASSRSRALRQTKTRTPSVAGGNRIMYVLWWAHVACASHMTTQRTCKAVTCQVSKGALRRNITMITQHRIIKQNNIYL